MTRGAGGCRSVVKRRRSPALFGVLCSVLCLGLMSRVAAAEPNERALWQLWCQHSTNALDHEALLASCQAFTNQNPSDPFVLVGQTMEVWNLLHLGRQTEAAAILTHHLEKTGTPLANGASYLAKSWMTRIDRDRVKAALQFYYRREVRYPRSLDELFAYAPLPQALAPPRQDQWGQDWRYVLVGFKALPGLLDQKYGISSSRLGEGSDLAEALAVPYGGLIRVRATRMLSSTPGNEIVEWMIARPPAAAAGKEKAKPAERTVALGVNSTAEGVFVAYVGRTILIVYDDNHWKLLIRPAG